MFDYDKKDKTSIILYAKKLKNQSLNSACNTKIEVGTKRGKGSFGQLLEEHYFGYAPNSNASADFIEANLELKASPLKTLKNGSLRAKERLVLNIINYKEVHKESFDQSSFWKKNANLLLVFYLYEQHTEITDYTIKLVDEWQYPKEDLAIIKNDWKTINDKIKAGKAHELSEGDTFYLGACTKGATAASSLREQPFNQEKAKQRAYSLKQSYVNHIIASIAQDTKGQYGKIISSTKTPQTNSSIEEIVIGKFTPFYNKTPTEIQQHFNLDSNTSSKSYYSSLTKKILGIELNQEIEEFEKAGIIIKTVRLNNNNLPKEHISFPSFKYKEITTTSWENSKTKRLFESKFFFVFYQETNDQLRLKKVQFWNMPNGDLLEVEKVWTKTQELVQQGNIVSKITDSGIRKTYFPNKKDNPVCHIRPHAQNSDDTYELPVKDKTTGNTTYTKHSFWLNDSYIKEHILK